MSLLTSMIVVLARTGLFSIMETGGGCLLAPLASSHSQGHHVNENPVSLRGAVLLWREETHPFWCSSKKKRTSTWFLFEFLAYLSNRNGSRGEGGGGGLRCADALDHLGRVGGDGPLGPRAVVHGSTRVSELV